jgi:hypothetical protein
MSSILLNINFITRVFCIIRLKPLSSSKHPYKAFSIVCLFSSSLFVWLFLCCRSIYACLHPILRAMNRVGEKLQLVPVIHDRGDGLKLCEWHNHIRSWYVCFGSQQLPLSFFFLLVFPFLYGFHCDLCLFHVIMVESYHYCQSNAINLVCWLMSDIGLHLQLGADEFCGDVMITGYYHIVTVEIHQMYDTAIMFTMLLSFFLCF